MIHVILAVCRHLSSRYREHTDVTLVRRRQRIVLALEPEKSRLERELVRAAAQGEVWDLTFEPGDERLRHMQQRHRDLLSRCPRPDYVCCLTSTWIRAANTAGLSSEALANDYQCGPLLPCRLLDSSQYRDLSALEQYAALYAAYVHTHHRPPDDFAFLQGRLSVTSSAYETWQHGKQLVYRLCTDPVGTLHAYGCSVPSQVRTLLVMAYSHKEVWEQVVTDAYSEHDYHFDGSLNPGEIMLVLPEGDRGIRFHLPESVLPPAVLPLDYFRPEGRSEPL